jgi:outer membrane lipoprotein-sorting protein
VPFGQKAETVLEHFAVSRRPAKKSDPAKTDYLKLVTRPKHERDLNVVWIEMWVHRDSGLPIRIVTEDRSENRTTVVFKNITTPDRFDRKIFELPRPPRDWEYRVEKFEGSVK